MCAFSNTIQMHTGRNDCTGKGWDKAGQRWVAIQVPHSRWDARARRDAKEDYGTLQITLLRSIKERNTKVTDGRCQMWVYQYVIWHRQKWRFAQWPPTNPVITTSKILQSVLLSNVVSVTRHGPVASMQAGTSLLCKTKTLQSPDCHTRHWRPWLSPAHGCSHADLAPCKKDLMGAVSLMASSWETNWEAGGSCASAPSPAHKVGMWDMAWELTWLHCLFLSCGASGERWVCPCNPLALVPFQIANWLWSIKKKIKKKWSKSLWLPA